MYFLKALTVFQLSAFLVWAVVVNRTIDDSFGDSQTGLLPIYFPTTVGVWKDQGCTNCAINPNVSMAFKKTYTAVTYHPGDVNDTITMRFNGTAIYVYFILANNAGDGITTTTNCDFLLNDDAPVNFGFAPDLTTTAIQYNQLVYSQTDLPFAQHTLVITTAGVDYNVYINFDYAIYTHDDTAVLQTLTSSATSQATTATSTSLSTSSSSATATSGSGPATSPKAPVAAIAGGVTGGLALLVFFTFFIFWKRRERSRDRRYGDKDTDLSFEVDPLPQDLGHTYPDPYTQPYPYHPGPGPSSSDIQALYSPVAQQPYSAILSSSSIAAQQQSEKHRLIMRSTENAVPPIPVLLVHPPLETNPTEQDRIREARQAELGLRLRTVEEEMNELAVRDLKQPRSGPSESARREVDSRDDEIMEMRGQMRRMQEEIGLLRENQTSEWAQGLTDEPPPGYTPAAGTRHQG